MQNNILQNEHGLPLVTGQWIITALRGQMQELKSETETLYQLSNCHRLPREVLYSCQEIKKSVAVLDNHLCELERRITLYQTEETT